VLGVLQVWLEARMLGPLQTQLRTSWRERKHRKQGDSSPVELIMSNKLNSLFPLDEGEKLELIMECFLFTLR
jgi:hypothetical protein